MTLDMAAEQGFHRWGVLAQGGGTRAFRGLTENSSARIQSSSSLSASHSPRILVYDHAAVVRGQGATVGDRRRGGGGTRARQDREERRDYVVLLAAEDLESIEATLELLSDPDAQSRVARAEEEIEQGDVLDEAQVRALLAARRSGSIE